jgi:hypothetical protein
MQAMRPPRRRVVAVPESMLEGFPSAQITAFPDLDKFAYKHAIRPSGASLRAWPKLEETERRLAVFSWVTAITDPNQPQYHTFLDDCETGFLMAFEATLQFLKDQFKVDGVQPPFEEWLKLHQAGRSEDIFLRGIRTLRHLEAHVRAELPHSLIVVVASRPHVKRQWQLPPLTEAHLDKLWTPRLEAADLTTWNRCVESTSAEDVMTRALSELADVVEDAEQHHR